MEYKFRSDFSKKYNLISILKIRLNFGLIWVIWIETDGQLLISLRLLSF